MNLPALGPCVPQTGNVITKLFGRIILQASGWKVEGTFPDLNKFIIIFAPHRSNWDFIFGIATKIALGINASWIGKSTLFIFPLGLLFRYIGGIPILRNRKTGAVKQIVNEFVKRDHLILAIAPEGTRSKVKKWKTGFYNIANEAKVPILLMSIDYDNKIIVFGKLIETTGDMESDMNIIEDFYKPYIKEKK
jgi:1-acyl-sn-glycerol-3-phosphate acyltransferase